MPHGLSVDAEGNLWVTDVAMHQVKKKIKIEFLNDFHLRYLNIQMVNVY
jgi:hypothetical protein